MILSFWVSCLSLGMHGARAGVECWVKGCQGVSVVGVKWDVFMVIDDGTGQARVKLFGDSAVPQFLCIDHDTRIAIEAYAKV